MELNQKALEYFPTLGGGLGTPHLGLLQIPFPYVLYDEKES